MNPSRLGGIKCRHPLVAVRRKRLLRRLAVQHSLQSQSGSDLRIEKLYAEPRGFTGNEGLEILDSEVRQAVPIQIRFLRVFDPAMRSSRSYSRRQEAPHGSDRKSTRLNSSHI